MNRLQILRSQILEKEKPDWSSVVGTGSMNINFNFWWTILYILLGIIFLPIYLFDYIKEKIDE